MDSPLKTAGNDVRHRQRPNCIQLLKRRVDRVSHADALEWIRYFLLDGRPHQIVTANPLMILASLKDEELAAVMEDAELVVPESSGIAWAANQCGTPLEQIVPGIDLFQAMCRVARDTQKSIFLLGAEPGVAEKAAVTLAARYPGLRIAGTHHGYFRRQEDETAVIAQIRESAADFVFVGMSVPHQEKWIRRNLKAMGAPVVMGIGGSFDVLSGRLRRAPQWLRDLGMEWVFRTAQQPWRIKRIVHLPLFVLKILTSPS
jgi:N-acetylglucosaminyldiphosphoundecaprenol N-acetyl-beta-D-mannosaminyltransferase